MDLGLSLGKVKDFLHLVQTVTGAHPTSYPIVLGGGGGLSPGVKRPGREPDHSHPNSAEV
jgi:hypothetical protein